MVARVFLIARCCYAVAKVFWGLLKRCYVAAEVFGTTVSLLVVRELFGCQGVAMQLLNRSGC